MKEMDHQRQVVTEQFLQREYNVSHLSTEKEYDFYNAVKDGDLNKVKKIMLSLENKNLGHLSDNRLRNLKYHLIITIALITRFCIEGGMAAEDAYSLSDAYIQQLDTMKIEEDITDLHQSVVIDYTKKMKNLKGKKKYSTTVLKIMDFIYDHLHEKISLDEIADFLGLDKTFLCKLFKEQTGLSIGNYITEKKVELAKNMLKYSDYSCIDISTYLGFSSHSYFISVFRKSCGLTPKQFREKNFRSEFTK